MKHHTYHWHRETWLERFKRWFPLGFRWVVKNPEFTKKNKPGIADLFGLKR